MTKLSNKLKEGDTVVCVVAETQFYKQGKTYKIYLYKGNLCVRGSDNMYDDLNKMSSSFKKVK